MTPLHDDEADVNAPNPFDVFNQVARRIDARNEAYWREMMTTGCGPDVDALLFGFTVTRVEWSDYDLAFLKSLKIGTE